MNRKLVKLLIAITSAFLCLTGCRRNTAEPIILPTVDDICSINIELIDGRQMSYENSESIKQIISAISIGKATNKESVQDFPSEDEYGTINIESNDGTTTVFYYVNSGKYFVEQPYQGIYEAVGNLENSLINVK
ncbi:DUF5301 domain-containing protein [Enterocloster sp. OA13]|uniref:DUF5301 domain-containing protein n=1 Tax=Enterocloster hominis (ex Hitch et al. 2024) TaxID=1917870 RepID=A0ABV1DIA4_9FIRM|nr:DUF5301 domain-containing protein [Lachnoclostridium pacaense]EEQ56518.1 hypothetical protein CBFG_00228 [Clostridiales bacterium 1_7_47FAA]MCC2818146.1 DUF5301 domain-containing protein [Lachnoclostridium pacaense]MCH1949686.1 DUF5301 domain-containing protein [Enterocloster sp. OA13]RJW51555.1 hypothetical protein DXC92_04510 [Clostridiales bacterium TF09-2AC]